MSAFLAHSAFEALQSGDSKWQRLHVCCESNRLLAVYFWLLAERQGTSGHAVDLYSKAFRSVAGTEWPIATLQDLQAVKNIGPRIAKIVVDYLWKHYPPHTDIKKVLASPKSSEKRSKKPPGQKKGYRPAPGTANYAFMIVLHQAQERGEQFLTKTELMERAEKSGLSDSCIYGNDPLVTRKGFQAIARSNMIMYNGWKSTSTLKKQVPPLVEIFGKPRKISLTQAGSELAIKLKEEALAAGKLKKEEPPVNEEPAGQSVHERLPSRGRRFETNESVVVRTPGAKASAVLPRASIEALNTAIKEVQSVSLPFVRKTSRFSDEFELVLLVDQREQFSRSHPVHSTLGRSDALDAHVNVLAAAGVTVSVRQLDVGDALWIARRRSPFPNAGEEFVLDWIVERKRVDDLASSIIDKRYEQQKYWLRKCGIQNVIYLVEGDPKSIERGSAVRTATLSTEVLDGFRVVRTRNYEESLSVYAEVTHALQRQLDRAQTKFGCKAAPTLLAFNAALSNMKRQTHKDIWGVMLTRIAGIGPDSVEAIAEAFPTPQSLYEAHITATCDSSVEKQIAAIRTKETGRRVGPVKAQKFLDSLFD